MEQIIKHGVDNYFPHRDLVGQAFTKGFNWVANAVNLMHVRFAKSEHGVEMVAFTKNAQKYLESRL